MGTRYFHCTLQCHKNVFRPSKRPWSQFYSWQRVHNPLFYKDPPPLYRLPHFFKFCPTHLSLLTYFFGWMGGPAHLLCYFVFNDIVDLQVPSLDTLLYFLATSRQVYRGLTHEWYVIFCYSILILQSFPYKIKCEEKLVSNVSPVFFTLVHLRFSLFKSKTYKKRK